MQHHAAVPGTETQPVGREPAGVALECNGVVRPRSRPIVRPFVRGAGSGIVTVAVNPANQPPDSRLTVTDDTVAVPRSIWRIILRIYSYVLTVPTLASRMWCQSTTPNEVP